jgi:hypothetical protein
VKRAKILLINEKVTKEEKGGKGEKREKSKRKRVKEKGRKTD